MHHIGDALLACGFSDPVMDMEHLTLCYQNLRTLLMDLKKLGAHNARVSRSKSLLGKNKWLALQQAYEKFRSQSSLPASYEVVYGHAWGAESRQQAAIHISLDDIK